MLISKEVLESIIDSYSYEIVFVDRNHIVSFMNKTARLRYGSRLQVGNSIFSCHNKSACARIENSSNGPMLARMKCLRS